MRLSNRIASLIAIVLFVGLANAGTTWAQVGNTNVRQVVSGKKLKIQGIVIRRTGDSFRVRDIKSVETDVVLTPASEVRTHKYGVFRGGTHYDASSILRGLRLQVEGVGNPEGQLTARTVKFDERDLRMAQALQATVDPVEQLAQSNQERITVTEKNTEKMAGQIDENTVLANNAQATATRARVTAEAALKSATTANNRIGGLGLYDTLKVITVYFDSGSSALSGEAKATMDSEAVWAKVQNTQAWAVEVVGFADSTGTSGFNKQLSEQRTRAVIDYLVLRHNLSLDRVIRPFGFGSEKPVADNQTPDGRAKNRRVEIRILVNKGIAGSE